MERENLPGGYVLGEKEREEKGITRGQDTEWKTVYKDGRKMVLKNKPVYWVKTPKNSARWDTPDHKHIVPVFEDNPIMKQLDMKGYEVLGTEEDRLAGRITIPKRFVDEAWHDPDAKKNSHVYEPMDFEEPAANEYALAKAERILRREERQGRREQLAALASEVTRAKQIIKADKEKTAVSTAEITPLTKRRGRPRIKPANETQLSS